MADAVPLIKAAQVSLAFNMPEDRLFLWFANKEGKITPGLFLTRRMTARLIDGVAGLLARSSSTASRAPEEMRDDIVLMERQGAMAAAAQSAGDAAAQPAASAPAVPTKAVLLQKVDIATKPATFQLVLHPAGANPFAVEVNRADLHLMLEALQRRAGEAGWNLSPDTSWLSGAPDQVTLN